MITPQPRLDRKIGYFRKGFSDDYHFGQWEITSGVDRRPRFTARRFGSTLGWNDTLPDGAVMPLPTKRNSCALALSMALLLAGTGLAGAQLSDAIEGALGGGDGASGGSLLEGLGGGSMPSLDSVGVGNLAGVLTYCAKNNALSDVTEVKDGLIGKLGGEEKAEADPGYQEGLSGVLGGKSDDKLDLSADGLQKQLTDTVCEQVMKYGKSLL